MYITMQTIKRNLGLFNLEVADLIIGTIFAIVSIIFFLTEQYTIALVVLSFGIVGLVPISFSKMNRIYKLLILFFKYLFKDKEYLYYKTSN